MCWPIIWEFEGGNSRDLGRGNDRGPKAHEEEAGEALKGTVVKELHYELAENRAKSKMRQHPGRRNRRMDTKGPNPSSGEG